ncbi:hypothetical protein [Rugamonas aquatica]|uniref:Uncharacterized protein n=1 Tax=Rugamonas aquatica TaxID=2743357 RepID=A0A6A7N2R3_9BURK|nr:hypothetical protein [Rugamonas aquatica]MQA39267.1 hypothetical protein [Rugamonas aquatica]
MKKKKILGGVLLFALAVFVIGDIYDRYPHAKDVKDLPKGKPVIVLSFQGAPPDDLQYMSVILSYSASRPDDKGVSREKSCNGIILHVHPCSVFVEARAAYPTGYVDRERGEVSFPFDVAIDGPGAYRLDSFAVFDNKYRYVDRKNGDDTQYGDFSVNGRNFTLAQSTGGAAHAAGFVRHTDVAKNALIRTSPGTFDIEGEATVIPYLPDGERLHRALAELRQKKYEDPDNKPVGFIDRNGHFVMAAMTAGHMEMGPENCGLRESEPLGRALAKKPLFKKIERASVTPDPASDQDSCYEIRVSDRGDDWHTYFVRSRGNKIFARRSDSLRANYIDAMWVDKKLIYAFSLKQDRTKGDDAPASVHFLDDEFIKIYPDEKRNFPAGELEQLESAVGQITAAKAGETGRGKSGA